MAISDEKAAKIADTSQKTVKEKIVDTRPPITTQDIAYESKKSQDELIKLREEQIYKTEGRRVKLPTPIKQTSFLELLTRNEAGEVVFPTPNDFVKKDTPQFSNKVHKIYGNVEDIVNAKYQGQISKVENPSLNSRRLGLLSYKIGMTNMWDKWGRFIPLTVLHVDRVQVTQVK